MHWILRHSEIPPPSLKDWAQQLEISEELAFLLWQRNLHDPDTMQRFLNPALRHLEPLENWPGLNEAGLFLAEKLLVGKKTCIWGDYDVDGISATALLLEFLHAHGFSSSFYIPDRLTEGYGLNRQGITSLHAQDIQVLVTVDTGISDLDAVQFAKSLGMDVIITDHHLPGAMLPQADIILNPSIPPSPCPALAGVGVAFFLAAATNAALHKKGFKKIDIRQFLDLVALGTLADLVDLHDQNRILVKNGLLLIGEGHRVGLAALKRACNLAPTAWLGSSQIVFTLAPRINAAGRLGASEYALELLLSKNRDEAAQLAQELSRLNAQRKNEEERIVAEAKQQAEQQAFAGKQIVVVYQPDWHPGIIGIVASRLVEILHKPAVVLCLSNSQVKGSARSIPGFNIHDAFSQCCELLSSFGGHRMAAGLSLPSDKIDALHNKLNSIAAEKIGPNETRAVCKLDKELPFSAAANFSFLKELEMLQPFGMGNAEPVFYTSAVRVNKMRSKPGLLLLELEDEKTKIKLQAKAWRQVAEMPLSMQGKKIHIAYTPKIDRYNGTASVELRLRDWKSAELPLELIPHPL